MAQDIPLLLDFYGQLLTPKTRTLLELYYEEDMSFSEIAAEIGISRQAACDSVHRGLRSLKRYEEKLGLAARFLAQKEIVELSVDLIERNRVSQAAEQLRDLLKRL